jgi:hypothetical protein
MLLAAHRAIAAVPKNARLQIVVATLLVPFKSPAGGTAIMRPQEVIQLLYRLMNPKRPLHLHSNFHLLAA